MSSDRYKLGEKLGAGNSTTGVFLAEHLDLGRTVAVKLLALDSGIDRADLLNEAKKMAALPPHDHVVQVLDAGDWDDNHVYIASEACMQGTLNSESDLLEGLDPAQACRLISDSCRGLDHMHQNGLLHLDVRPANIFLADGRPRIGDFGLAKWSKNAIASTVYTPHAAPELLLNQPATTASDQFATAMSLAHILTGGVICSHPPHDLIAESKARRWPDLDLLGFNVPEKLKRVLAQATRFDPSDRFASIEEFKRAIDLATPAVSFRNVNQVTMASTDNVWNTVWGLESPGYFVTVRKRGRRDSKLSVSGVTEREAKRVLRQLITNLAG
jgi:eukaryotic-like serine/threonine-protein kinase